jgi:hypothetical protein
VTVSRPDRRAQPVQEHFVPVGRLPMITFLSGVLALILLAGWLSRIL